MHDFSGHPFLFTVELYFCSGVDVICDYEVIFL